MTVLAGGPAGINQDVTNQVTKSLAIAEAIAVPLTLVLLLFAFGSLVSALLPLAVGGVAILGTFAELYLLGSVTDVSIFAINLTTALGLGLGIDYALFIVSRFREQLAAGDDVPTAVARTVATAGRTVIYTAVAVMAALAALLVFPLYFLRSFGYAGIGVVAIAALGALVLLPALLAVLGHRVNAGRVRWTRSAEGAASPVLGPARRPGHAATGTVRPARHRGSARRRRSAARHHVRHPGPGRAPGGGGQPAGGRRAGDAVPGQRRRAHRHRHRRPGRSGGVARVRPPALPAAGRGSGQHQRRHATGRARPARPPRRTRPWALPKGSA